jgi:predicted nucleotidyltransferase
MARDLLPYYAHGIRTARATEDVDLALAVADWNDFERLRESLLTSGSFEPHPKVAHKLLYRRRMEVDFIPFGGVERADGMMSPASAFLEASHIRVFPRIEQGLSN